MSLAIRRLLSLALPVRRCLFSVAAPSWPYDNRPLTADEKARVSRKDADLRATYDAVKSEYPAHAQPTDGSQQVDKLEAYRKRLIYRSKQRGWLEVDLLMGSFATAHVPTMTLQEMQAYERILSCETVDLFNYVSGQQPPPADLDVAMMKRIRDYVDSKPVGVASPGGYMKIKGLMSN